MIVMRIAKEGPTHMLSKPQIHKFITVTTRVSEFINHVSYTNAKILSSHAVI